MFLLRQRAAPVLSRAASTNAMSPLVKRSPFNKLKEGYKPIVWIDCEMTGLDVFHDHIIEICCIITDGDLNVVDQEGYESVIHQSKPTMDAMGAWCIEHHGRSGLTDQVLASTKTVSQVEAELLAYVQHYTNKNTAVLGGNSVHMDRAFMIHEMPQVLDHLHYRIIDVSTITEIGRRHNNELVRRCPGKKGSHTARADILESIEQLRWYRDHYFVQPISEQQ